MFYTGLVSPIDFFNLEVMPTLTSLTTVPVSNIPGVVPSPALAAGDVQLSTHQIPSPGLSTLPMGNTDWVLPAAGRGLSLSMSARPFLERLVRQIRKSRFVEMRDILGDNTAVRHHFEDLHGALGLQLLPVLSRLRIREVHVTSLPS